MAAIVPTGTMRALLLTRASATSPPALSLITSQPIPTLPANHLLIKIHASAIQPSDILNANGGFGTTTFPRIPGRDFSGVVVASNPAGSPLLNQPVFGTSGSTHAFTVDGFQAEYAVVPSEGVAPKPAVLSHVQAATVGVPFTTAALAVRRAGVVKGETALVLGASGAVGSAVCAILEDSGVRVIRGRRGPRDGDSVDTAGDPGLSKVATLTGGKGVDAVIDTVGLPELTRASIDNALGAGGRLAFIAAPKNVAADLAFDMKAFYRQQKSVLGVNSIAFDIGTMARSLEGLGHLFQGEKWKDAVGSNWEEVSLEDAVAAYANKEKGKKFVVKIAS